MHSSRPRRSAPPPPDSGGSTAARLLYGLGVAAALLGAGCDASPPLDDAPPAPTGNLWERSQAPNAAGSSGLAVPGPPNDRALAEILTHVPEVAQQGTGPDGGTLIGSNTERAEDASLAEPETTEIRPRAVVKLGTAKKQPGLSSAGIERALRAGLYYELVQKCRAPDGGLLPPDAIKLQFTVAADGTIAPSTIVATAASPEHRDAASCMRRALGAVSFRGPSSARGQTTDVTALVPSVD